MGESGAAGAGLPWLLLPWELGNAPAHAGQPPAASPQHGAHLLQPSLVASEGEAEAQLVARGWDVEIVQELAQPLRHEVKELAGKDPGMARQPQLLHPAPSQCQGVAPPPPAPTYLLPFALGEVPWHSEDLTLQLCPLAPAPAQLCLQDPQVLLMQLQHQEAASFCGEGTMASEPAWKVAAPAPLPPGPGARGTALPPPAAAQIRWAPCPSAVQLSGEGWGTGATTHQCCQAWSARRWAA